MLEIMDTPTKLRRTFYSGIATGALVMWLLMMGVSFVWIERSKDTTEYIEEQRHIANLLTIPEEK